MYLHLFAEGLTPVMTAIPQLGYGHLFANAMVAFMFDIATLLLLDVSGILVVTLAGAFKVKSSFNIVDKSNTDIK
jgi:hypothetical protein